MAPLAAGRASPSANAIYDGFKAQRNELQGQLNDLEGTRREITGQLEELPSESAERKPLEDRLANVDTRIKAVDQMLAGNAAQLSQAAAIPGAVVEPPQIVREGPPEEAYVVGTIFMLITLLPLSVALARRIWRKSATVITSFPKELSDRLLRLEQATEATSLEVERIGEGQRFLTKLFTEGEGTRAIGAGAARPIETKPQSARERLP
ncbi:MAG TPA: hypothetical protein VGN73_00640 [Gemmatimonadaceae bacterium]|nr:hypothetical protein [Gemmatimonadaceae bacterium]